MPTIAINGLNYFYQVQGSGSPLILLHGFTGSSTNWLEFLEPFAEHFKVVLIDLPGHGRSASPPNSNRYTLPSVSHDLVAIIQALRLPAVNLLGYSMGGRLALYMALQHPSYVQSLMLESASPGLQSSAQRQLRRESDNQLASEIEESGIATFVHRWQQLPLFATQQILPAEQKARLYQQRLDNSAPGLANSLRGMGTGWQPSLWSELWSIHLPVLILAGGLDKKYEHIARQMTASIPSSTLKIIAGAGHNIHLEKPQLFTSTIMCFLAELQELANTE